VRAPEGEVDALRPPLTFPGRELGMGPIPALGEHTRAVREWVRDGA
jgi:hypothetical protein